MNSNTLIAIPSRERAEWLMNLKTDSLSALHHLEPVLFVREDDSQYATYDKYSEDYDCKLVAIPHYRSINMLGIAQTYDYIIEWAIERGYERLIIADDDLDFRMVNPIPDAKPDYKLCSKFELNMLMQYFSEVVCEQMPMMAITPMMTRSVPYSITPCKPMTICHSYYLPFFNKNRQFRFWKGKEIESRCDHNLTLSLLRHGYLTAYFAKLFTSAGLNNPGGCSVYRNLKCEQDSVDFLKTKYRKFVKTHPKKGWMDDKEHIREGLTIQWKQAFNKEKFGIQFGIDANTFIKQKIKDCDKWYSSFIKELRNG